MVMPKRNPMTGDLDYWPAPPTLLPQPQDDLVRMLQEDNARMKKAGSELAAAALRVAAEYDGLHRLMLAAAAWAQALADEGGRGKTPNDGFKRGGA